jgi:hypothetical protein
MTSETEIDLKTTKREPKINKIVEKLPDDSVEVSKYGNHELIPNEYFYSKKEDLFYHVKNGIIMKLHVGMDRKSRYVSMLLKDRKKNINVYYSVFCKN